MRKECVAMLLAGGQGSRLGILTQKLAKPAVPFGGKYRIIDFALSNCNNSGIDTVGVLTQYKPLALNSYIGIGSAWDLDRKDGGVFVLPPYAKEKEAEWYRGTADAIYQNINFLDMFHPAYVLILSGDHIYKMDYSLMLKHHKEQDADATIAVIEVPWEEAGRFGIMNTADGGRITEFEEKPEKPKSNLASMGIYIFNWTILRQYLLEDGKDEKSSRDFGKDIIPKMLAGGQKMFAYSFSGYWKDVGTVESFWEANMDLLEPEPELNIYDPDWRIYSVNPTYPPQYVAPNAQIRQSMICEGCMVFGEVEHSILFPGVYIGAGAKIKDSIVMSQCQVEANVAVNKAIIGQKAILKEGSKVGGTAQEIVLVGGDEVIPGNTALSRDQKEEEG